MYVLSYMNATMCAHGQRLVTYLRGGNIGNSNVIKGTEAQSAKHPLQRYRRLSNVTVNVL